MGKKEQAKRKVILLGCRPAVKGCSCVEAHYSAGHCSTESRCEGDGVAVVEFQVVVGEDGKARL